MTVQAHFCKIESRVQGGMQFGALVQVVFWGAVWGAGDCAAPAWVHFCEIDERENAVWGGGAGLCFGVLFGVLFELLVTVRRGLFARLMLLGVLFAGASASALLRD